MGQTFGLYRMCEGFARARLGKAVPMRRGDIWRSEVRARGCGGLDRSGGSGRRHASVRPCWAVCQAKEAFGGRYNKNRPFGVLVVLNRPRLLTDLKLWSMGAWDGCVRPLSGLADDHRAFT